MTNPREFFSRDEDQVTTTIDINFGEEEVINAINEIKENSTAGPDQLPAILLKICEHSLATPITAIWRKSIEVGDIPTKFKEGLITPIFKSGSMTSYMNGLKQWWWKAHSLKAQEFSVECLKAQCRGHFSS